MLIEQFKSAKSLEIEIFLKAYLTKHYDSNSYSQIQPFISELLEYRSMISSLNDFDKSYEKLKSYKDTLISYLNMVCSLKSKITFGKEEYSLKVEFTWMDVLKEDYYTSYNINFEFYSALFNLGVLYNLIGRFSLNSNDDEKLKEGIKYFQMAAGVFDKIKSEITTSVPLKELSPDLSANYLSYCSYIVLAQAQSLLVKVAEKKNMALDLQAQLLKGVSDLYSNTFNLVNDSLKKMINEGIRVYLNNRKYYYNALAFLKLKDKYAEVFNTTGEKYGTQIAYIGLACDCLNQASKDINKVSIYLDVTEFNKFKCEIENLGNEMLEKNKRIYYDSIPDLMNLPKIEKNIKVNPLINSDDFNKLERSNTLLDNLMPREIKPLIANYKNQMMGYISENLDKFENEAKITKFLQDLNLPFSFDSVTSSGEIPGSLWKKISEIQQKGGSLYLSNQISNLEKFCDEINRRINDIELLLYNEEEEDHKLRSLYGNKWTRLPSKSITNQYYQILNEFKSKLNIAKQCDSQIKKSILENIKYFDLINLSQQSLLNKIPVKNDDTNINIKNSEEAKSLAEELENLDGLKDKCMEVIDRIFQNLNDDNIIPQFLQVLQKKSTEKAIFSENKTKYDPFYTELQILTEKIDTAKKSILEKYKAFSKVKSQYSKPIEENEKFFKDLENYIGMFNQKLINLNQGINFYNEYQKKLNEVSEKVTDFLLARDMEKNELIKYITSGQNIMLSSYPMKEPSFLDPIFNTITNLNYNYRYNSGHDGKYYK